MFGKTLFLYALSIILCLHFTHRQGDSQPLFLGINCGSPDSVTTHQGDLYVSDRPYVPGSFGYVGGTVPDPAVHDIIGGSDGLGPLIPTRRTGEFSYIFDVPPGWYAVNLTLCELDYDWKAMRTFSVAVAGDTVLQNFDIFNKVGKAYCLPMRFPAYCEDGQLTVDFIPGIAGGTVSAVSVCAVAPDAIAPNPPDSVSAIGGFEMNIIDWQPNSEYDLFGYVVYRRLPGQEWQLISPGTVTITRYLDKDVVPNERCGYQVCAVDLWGNPSTTSDSVEVSAVRNESSPLPRYRLQISDQNLSLLNANLWGDYVDADVILAGMDFPESGVRYRGNAWTRILSKKSYKVNLPDGMNYELRDKLNLNAEMRDATMLKEHLSYDVFALMGCLRPTHERVHLELNDEFIGVYLDFEQVDNWFLEKRGLPVSGNIYKCNSDFSVLPSYQTYQGCYPKENNPQSDWSDIISFIEWVNQASYETFHDSCGTKFALDEFLDQYVCLIATGNNDFISHNYFMYFNPLEERWYSVQYDFDNSFFDPQMPLDFGTRDNPHPIDSQWNRLLDKVLSDTLFRYSYAKKMERFLTTSLTPALAEAMVFEAYDRIAYDAVRDIRKKGWEDPAEFLEGSGYLAGYLEQRISFLLNELPQFVTDPDRSSCFRLNELQTINEGTLMDEAGDYDPWVELYNLSPVELDLENFRLIAGSQVWTLPQEAVLKGYAHLVLWLDGEPEEGPLHAPFTIGSSSGSLELLAPQGQYSDSVEYPEIESDHSWAREEDGSGTWNETLFPTPAATNTPPADPSLLVINEFLALNSNVNMDEFGEYDDWVEIYNSGDEALALGGLYLTDDLSRPTKWTFPDSVIPPQGFLIVWCDDEVYQGPMHASFRLSGAGEEIGLFDRDGITAVDSITFGGQIEDISCGRCPDGSDDWFYLQPSPGQSNSPTEVSPSSQQGDFPARFELYPAYPNPCNPSTTFSFDLPGKCRVEMSIFNCAGREIAALVNGDLPAGHHTLHFDASDISSGVYFLRFRTDDFTKSLKFVVLK